MHTETGGAAFPKGTPNGESGMDLRDYFAAHAMAAYTIATLSVERSARIVADMARAEGEQVSTWTAGVAYEIADAMIARRNRDRNR